MANSGGASDENDSQIKRHRRLPLELQCEAFSALPFQHGRRLLLVCHPIATNCVALVRKQKEKFENRWDPTACHGGLTLIEPDRLLMVQYNGNRPGCRYVFAERPIPRNDGIFYFEVNIVGGVHSGDAIGLAPKPKPLHRFIAYSKDTYAYWSNGTCGFFGGHADADRRQWNGKPSFGAGDVVGCGLNLATRQIIYTKNGERLDTTNLFVDDDFADDLFPFVMLTHPGDKIEANFGPNFKFNIAEVINRFYGIFRDI